MKKACIGMAVMLVVHCAHAQNWSEWFRQKKTQKKYLLEQIAALQVYLDYAKELYSIAKEGLTTIGRIKKGDFDLHDDYFSSLKKVNPHLATSAKVVAIIAKQLQLIKEAKKTVDEATQSKAFTAEEIVHCKSVFENLLASCADLLDELMALTTSGTYEMKDDERMARIDALYEEMQNKYAFARSYSSEMGLLSMQRTNEKVDLDYSRKLREGL